MVPEDRRIHVSYFPADTLHIPYAGDDSGTVRLAAADLHTHTGVLFHDSISRKFITHTNVRAPYEPWGRSWIGILREPPRIPRWYGHTPQSPQALLASEQFAVSMPYCRGLLTLSRYLRDWLEPRVSCPVDNLPLPASSGLTPFDPRAYRANQEPRLIQVGWWLRRFHSLYQVPGTRHQRTILTIPDSRFDLALDTEIDFLRTTPDPSRPVPAARLEAVQLIRNPTRAEYEALLSTNLLYLDLYDTSADQALVDALMRATPTLVNPLPAVREYLGHDYPLYFESPEEAAWKAEDDKAVLAAHQHMLDNPVRHRLAGGHFAHELSCTRLYQDL